MKTLYFDCGMGAAGDMLMASLYEICPDKEKFLKTMNEMGLPGLSIEAEPSVKCGITGTHMKVTIHGEEEESVDVDLQGHEHEHHQEHNHEDSQHSHAHDHHHDHEEHEHHHHDHDEECGCGHDHDHEEHEHHHHDHDHECGCGHDHDHEEHEHHHHDHDHECGCGHDHHDHHHHHADEVFTSWGRETIKKYTKENLEKMLEALSASDEYGIILRAKGMLPAEDGTWIYFDMVPEETEIREGAPEYTGRLCVIGSKLNEDKLAELFGL